MRRNFKIFWRLSINSIRTMLTHRVGVISFMAGKIIRFLVYFLFIYYLLSKTRLLAGYNLTQTAVFFLTFNFIDSFSQLLFREVYRFRPLVSTGELDGVLLKPYHPFLRVLIGGVDILDTILIFPYLALLIFFISQLSGVNFSHQVIYVGLIINALIIATGFHIIVLSLAILTTEVDHAIMIYRDFTRMVALPVDIYKEPIRSFLTFVVPVGVMMTVPVKALFGLISWSTLISSIFISFVFIVFSLQLWGKALKRYQSVGS
jgi:ABC-2 type transport system permease protein